jgi:hypothetical protein
MNYRLDIELFRIISAFGIVWFHSHLEGGDVGYAGLIYFTILSLYLSGDGRDVIHRLKRLMLPWLFWCLFYGFINLLIAKPFIDTNNGLLAGILTGPRIHLWYIPFICITLISFDLIKKNISVLLIGYASALIAFISLITVFLWRDPANSLGTPWAQHFHAFPAIFIGASFWAFERVESMFRIVFMLLLLSAAAINLNISGVGVTYIIGIALFCPILFLPPWLKCPYKITKISNLTLGIYLLHPFVFMVFFKLHFYPGFYLPIAVFIISGLTIAIAKKFFPKLTKYIT